MMEQTVNDLTRKLIINGAYDKRHAEDGKNYGVHGVEMKFYVVGPKGAVHFMIYTDMMLKKTLDWWESEGLGTKTARDQKMWPMGVDVGYHSPVPLHDFQKEDGPHWPQKMKKKDPNMKEPGPNATQEERLAYITNIEWEKIGDAPPNCDIIGVPCYIDGSAMRAEEWKDVFVEHGDTKIWEMLEQEYHDTFDTK